MDYSRIRLEDVALRRPDLIDEIKRKMGIATIMERWSPPSTKKGSKLEAAKADFLEAVKPPSETETAKDRFLKSIGR